MGNSTLSAKIGILHHFSYIFYVEGSEKDKFDTRRVTRASTVLGKVIGVCRNIGRCKLVSTQNG